MLHFPNAVTVSRLKWEKNVQKNYHLWEFLNIFQRHNKFFKFISFNSIKSASTFWYQANKESNHLLQHLRGLNASSSFRTQRLKVWLLPPLTFEMQTWKHLAKQNASLGPWGEIMVMWKRNLVLKKVHVSGTPSVVSAIRQYVWYYQSINAHQDQAKRTMWLSINQCPPQYLTDKGDGFVPHGVRIADVRLDHIGKRLLHSSLQLLVYKKK